jgi:hypothetical protein
MIPDNAIYFEVAYAAAAIIYGAYAVSVWWRAARFRR